MKNDSELDKYLEEIKERQDNQYNPGYHIGSGRVGKPISELSKYPVILIAFGSISLIICIFIFIKSGFSINNLGGTIICILISLAVIYGGISRLRSMGSKHK